MSDLWLVIVGMGIVTYLPRMLPIVFLKNIDLPNFWLSFLRFVPYATLGALIFPGILSSTGELVSAVFGGAVAVLLSMARLNITVVVLGSISAVYFVSLLL